MDKSSIDLSSPLLDSEQVQMLISSGGDEAVDLISEILELFREESEANLSALEYRRKEGDLSEMGRAAHALAGSSANIGAARLWQSAKSLEQSAKEGSLPEAEEIEDLKSLYEETIAVFKRIRSQLDK
jgi:HPt (histidine-containing phosphotransfer) domain-containing protein